MMTFSPNARLSGVRVLVADGSSLSAVEAVQALGAAGAEIDLVDPSRLCIARFSRYVRRVFRSPPSAGNPLEYVDFVSRLFARNRYDALYPAHEQAYLFAVHGDRLGRVPCSLAAGDAFHRLQTKTAFAAVLDELGLPAPRTVITCDRRRLLEALGELPAYVKTAVGTATRGVFRLERREQAARLVEALDRDGRLAAGVVVQEVVEGSVERTQALFDRGRVLAIHTCAQRRAGPSGGDAQKESVLRPQVQADVAKIGAALAWHGPLSIDHILRASGSHAFIDANPRLAEPGNAVVAGLDLPSMWVELSMGRRPAVASSTPGILTHMTLMAVANAALERRGRVAAMRELRDAVLARGAFGGSAETLTPVFSDPWSCMVLAPVVLAALVCRGGVAWLAKRQVAAYALDTRSFA